jgi:hypothetical protein
LDEKQGTMSSPYARCSLLHDYHRNNYKKFNYMKKSGNVVSDQFSGMMNNISKFGGTLTATARKSTQSLGSNIEPGTISSNASTVYNNGSGGGAEQQLSTSSTSSQQLNQDMFVDHFKTFSVSNNLNPVWRTSETTSNSSSGGTSKENSMALYSNSAVFVIDKDEYMFWGLAIEVDVLSNDVLIGTAVIDLMGN